MKEIPYAQSISVGIHSASRPGISYFSLIFGARPSAIQVLIRPRAWMRLAAAIRKNCRREDGRLRPSLVKRRGTTVYGSDIDLRTGRLRWVPRRRLASGLDDARITRSLKRDAYACLLASTVSFRFYPEMYEAFASACLLAQEAYEKNLAVHPFPPVGPRVGARVRECDYVQLVWKGELLLMPDDRWDFHDSRSDADLRIVVPDSPS